MSDRTIAFSPFTRLEGDLRVTLDMDGGRVTRAFASGTLFRGFEAMLRGRDPLDAIVIACRVCGQCGLTHSAAAAAAIRAISGAEVPPNAAVASNVMLAIETVLSHLTHFYLSFAPDLAEPPGDAAEARRFLPSEGRSFARALRERGELLGVLGLFAGKWPNSLAIQPGGTTRPVDASEIRRAHGLLGEYARFVEQQLIGDTLEGWLSLRSASDLERWMEEGVHASSDIGAFVRASFARGLDRVGAWPARFISSGGWRSPQGSELFAPGFHDGERRALDPSRITEHVAYSWYEQSGRGVPPAEGETDPAPERAEAYSWAKAPRYAGEAAEAGPLARMLIDDDPLVTDLVRRYGASAFARQVARLHEAIRLLRQIDVWLDEVDPREPFLREVPRAAAGSGMGLIEAPRGILGHWIRVENGEVRNYQIVTPTAWNLSPRDDEHRPGPLEQALVGAPIADPEHPSAVSYIVKSFDPCLYCTVH